MREKISSRKLPAAVLAAAAVAVGLVAASPAATAPGDSADLQVVKSDSPDPVTVGAVLTYTIKVTNLGPQAATGTTVTDKLPSNADFVSAAGGTCDRKGRNVTCALGSLGGSGTEATVTISVRPKKAGTLTNTASADSVENDPVAANSEDSETTTVRDPATPPAAASCRGAAATITGTGGSDTLTGTPARDVVAAFAGNDVIRTFGSRDLVCAGRGSDYAAGGSAADRVFGGAGGDRLLGRGGPDALIGNGGNDVLKGNRGNDRLRGGEGTDRCRGGAGGDSLSSCEA